MTPINTYVFFYIVYNYFNHYVNKIEKMIMITLSDIYTITTKMSTQKKSTRGRKPIVAPCEPAMNFDVNTIYEQEQTPSYSQHIEDLQLQVKQLNENLSIANDKLNIKLKQLVVDHSIVNIADSTDKIVKPEKSKLLCWWCTCPFNNIAFYIPTKMRIIDDKECYEVYGNFCSVNCAAAYTTDNSSYNNHDKLSLLNHIYDTNGIVPAPHKECLKSYGGNMTIDEFRNSSIYGNSKRASSTNKVTKIICNN